MENSAAEHELTIVGIGPGGRGYVLPDALAAIEKTHILVGGRRALTEFARPEQTTLTVTGDIGAALDAIKQALQTDDVTVMVSGDPGYYSLLPVLREKFAGKIRRVIPGIGSLQLAFARLALPWQEAILVSFHGREPNLAKLEYAPGKIIGALTDGKYNSQTIASRLIDLGWLPNSPCHICSRLSYPDENIVDTTLRGAADSEPIAHAVIIVEGKAETIANKSRTAQFFLGIDDAEFARGKIPMTKQEIRIVTIAKAHISPGAVVYDIGAGSGSITVEAARQAYDGQVFAWEKNPVGIELIKTNAAKFGVSNIKTVAEIAPGGMENLPPADVIIIGGSGGKLTEILTAADKKLKKGGRMVLNFIAVQNLTLTIDFMRRQENYVYEICQMQVSRLRRVGSLDMADALNPVYIMVCMKN